MIGYIACPECNGTGYIERERVAPWIRQRHAARLGSIR